MKTDISSIYAETGLLCNELEELLKESFAEQKRRYDSEFGFRADKVAREIQHLNLSKSADFSVVVTQPKLCANVHHLQAIVKVLQESIKIIEDEMQKSSA